MRKVETGERAPAREGPTGHQAGERYQHARLRFRQATRHAARAPEAASPRTPADCRGRVARGEPPIPGPVVDGVDMPDYHVVMISVGTADLKAHLSEHLQAVRRGETIVVLDRRKPIARIVPVGAAGLELVIRPALGALQDVPLLGPSRSAVDVLEQLRAERAERL